MPNKPRKPIADLIGELKSWLPNYDHGPNDYPTLLWRILASIPGGDQAEDMGYEPFRLGWHEVSQLGHVLEAIQDTGDVEALIAGLLNEEEEEPEPEPEPALPPPHPRGKRPTKTREYPARAKPGNFGPGTWIPSERRRVSAPRRSVPPPPPRHSRPPQPDWRDELPHSMRAKRRGR